MIYANIVTFLHFKNEINILKKVLLSQCFHDVQGIDLSMLDSNELIVKKIKEQIINQSPKYPKDGPLLDLGENNKYKNMLREFQQTKLDLTYTNEILNKLNDGLLIDAQTVINFNFNRLGGFT